MATKLPAWRCHKKVRACKIRSVIVTHAPNRIDIPGGLIFPEDMRFGAIEVSGAYLVKHKPTPGGYYVRYDDGYESFSPAKAFEEGYKRVK